MKKIILFVLALVVLLIQPLWAVTTVTALRDQIKMTLAIGEPQITDAIINDFLILALQNVATHGLAFQYTQAVPCNSSTKSYAFTAATGTGYSQGQGLFVKSIDKDENTSAHRSIWEIEPNTLGRKWLVNPPAYQYYYIWHKADTSFFSFYDPPVDADTVTCSFYFVPTIFKDELVIMPAYYEDVAIELCLFFCYVRLKDWNAAIMAYGKYTKNLSAIRELHINRQPDITFGPQEIGNK